jgi:hypothetical protein
LKAILHHENISDDVQVNYHSKYLDCDREKDNQVNLYDGTLHDGQDLFFQNNLYHLSIWKHCAAHDSDVVRLPVFDIIR